ncbi:uncharacterized protein LOC126674661 [Mercurialis annua]|uniref:uncharacterized protein LOC126674661 n=1 Tax=Mercurialis annua TaxID=3986 RepID=UPI002160D6AA|nr:uncharacterized protein LOC126674661 [Mercurialis annua]
MLLPASDIPPPAANSAPEMGNVYDEQHFRELKFLAVGESDSPTKKERQISVDPISLRESSRREASFNLMLPPSTDPLNGPPLRLPLIKTPNVSYSLSTSTSSSPRFSFSLLKKKCKDESQASPRQIERLTGRHSSAHGYSDHLTHSDEEEINLRRSKSCAEGRTSAPADGLDIYFSKSNTIKYETKQERNSKITNSDDGYNTNEGKNMEANDDEFKCGVLCMYLPGFGRGKPVKSKKDQQQIHPDVGNMISRTVSLEKFECGSWASSAIVNDDHEDDSMNLYFDLPLELIRTSVNDATSPVAAAFVFDKDRKGVLKNGCSTRTTARKSHESTRHVRFSTSSATSNPSSPAACITPRLRKAREDFNAFLEAQSA